MDEATVWLAAHATERSELEAGARSLLLCLGRSMALCLLVESASHAQKKDGDRRPTAAAHRFARHGTRFSPPLPAGDSALLANDP